MSATDHLTVLGSRVDGALSAEDLEMFDAPPGVDYVEFVTHEVTAFCPVTNQPDLYTVTIGYHPNAHCVESKSLKLYLMGFRDLGIFGESLAGKIADDLYDAILPAHLEVEIIQQIRGGLRMTARASR